MIRDERDDAPPLDLRSWRELAGRMLRHRAEVVLLVINALVAASVDACFPLVTREVIDRVLEDGAGARLAGPLLAYLGLLAVLSVSILFFIRFAARLATRVALDIRVAAFERLQRMSFGWFDRRPTGWLMARMTSDCDRLSRILAWGLLDCVWGFALMAGMATLLISLSPALGLATLSVVPALVVVSLRFQRAILGSARRVRQAGSRLTGAYAESFMALRTTRSLAREEHAQEEFRVLSTDMHAWSIRNAMQSAAYVPVILTISSAGVGLVLALGAGRVAAGLASVGTLVAFVTYALRFFDPVQELAATFASMQMAQAAAERVLGLVHAKADIEDGPGVQPAPSGRIGRIELRGVTFAYGDGPRILHGVDLDVPAGTTVALVGPTGGGKTTLASLVCRFHEPGEGEVALDGVDYRRLPLAWWRSQVAVVLQQPFLFSGSVRENIRYGRLEASDAEVEAAARLAGAHDAIASLASGYDTAVGERGVLLSAGQAQLVSIARAILADKPVLVLDEATSSIDAETERRIQAGLAEVFRGRTCFVIAHRLSTIRSADLIAVIDGGRIAERGTHEELVARRGQYRELVLQQGLRAVARDGSAWRSA